MTYPLPGYGAAGAAEIPDCPRCRGGRFIPYIRLDIYDVSWDENWIEALWQGYLLVIDGEEVPLLGLHPSLISYHNAGAGLVAMLRSHVWGKGDRDLINALYKDIPEQVEILTAEAPTCTFEQQWAFFYRAVATLCDLVEARDPGVIAHFPPGDTVSFSHAAPGGIPVHRRVHRTLRHALRVIVRRRPR